MPSDDRKNFTLLAYLISIVIAMVMLAFASVPLYNLFCKVTGFAGTPRQVTQMSKEVGTKKIEVRFNSDTATNLAWSFSPVQQKVEVITGENKLIFYEATNLTNDFSAGVATYNVTPDKAAKYFHKIYCFCFNKQILEPNQHVSMPVSFYIDPAIEKEAPDVDSVTLSYSFFKYKE